MKKLFPILLASALLVMGCAEKEEAPAKPVDPELEKAVKEGKSYMPEEARRASQAAPGNNMNRTR